MKLTKPQLDELRRLGQKPQPTYGRWRARVQNSLQQKGLARVDLDCAITEAGRAELVKHQ